MILTGIGVSRIEILKKRPKWRKMPNSGGGHPYAEWEFVREPASDISAVVHYSTMMDLTWFHMYIYMAIRWFSDTFLVLLHFWSRWKLV